MIVQIVDNKSRDMATVLGNAIQRSNDARIAVAFVSRGGLALLDASMKTALETQAYLEFLVGLDMRATEPEALMALYNLSQANPNVSLVCYGSLEPAAIYHPKMYLLKSAQETTAIIGSSNLTEGGLKRNTEINAVIQGTAHEEVISDLYDTYNRLKFHPKRVVPDLEFLGIYSELCHKEKQQRRQSAQDPASRKLTDAFNEKARSLRAPTFTKRDIVGWLELVYDSLPEGEFTNQQVYALEPQFQARYPGNANIQAKIRQKLQDLRELGFVEHLATGRWRKV